MPQRYVLSHSDSDSKIEPRSISPDILGNHPNLTQLKVWTGYENEFSGRRSTANF